VKRKVTGAFFVMALLLSTMGLTLFSLAEANPLPAPPILQVYIRSNGTVYPSTVPIQREGNIYTFTSDVTNATVEVQCDNIVIDGAGFMLQGNGQMWNTAITLTNRSNVVIKNLNIRNYWMSIVLTASSNVIIYNNSMLTAWNIILDSSVGNQIVRNNITGQDTDFGYCIRFDNGAADNLVMGNNLVDAGLAVTVNRSSGGNNTFYLNNFFNNYNNDVGGWTGALKSDFWDNGTLGNFWSKFIGSDRDGDGVSDTLHVINDHYRDRHPLMAPFDVSSVTVEMPEWVSSETQEAEPQVNETFPATLVAAASGTSLAIVGAVLLIYFRKRNR
jgi:nitrous oxidase accessory protein NosD